MRKHNVASLFALLVLALFVGACGDDESSETSSSNPSSTTAEGASGFDPAPFQAIVDKAAVPDAFPELPPSEPKAGLKIAALTCSLALEGCKIAADAQKEAAKAMGVELTVLDTEGAPEKTVSAFKQAERLGFDGLTLLSLDPNVSKPHIAAARKRGVPVLTQGMMPLDYNDNPSDTGPNVDQTRHEDVMGSVSAANMILDKEGKVKVLVLSAPEYATVKAVEDGFRETLKECSTCEIADTLTFTGADTTTTLPTQVQAKLQADREINAVWVGSDAFLTAVNPVIENLGRDDVHTYATDGQKNVVEIIAKGGPQRGTVAVPSTWLGWAMIDNINRLAKKEEPLLDSSPPVMVVNEENAEDFLGEFGSPIDYQAGFKKVWGVG